MTKAGTALALGVPNIVRAGAYRLGVKLALNPVRWLKAVMPQGPFFDAVSLRALSAPPVTEWQTAARLFSYWEYAVGACPPDWLANPFTGKRMPAPDREWWLIHDFDADVGDIKLIWELSRMDWVLAFAQRARNGDAEALDLLNRWLSDWCQHNPPYYGPNWKCGQEASIRVMHLAMGALILGQAHQPAPGLRDLVCLHLQRIAPTVQYAMAQDNNHGTSEAAALFIGGSWLATLGVVEGLDWQKTGRYWLENRAARLIGEDGSFSQYSVNYHRMMLDTFCMVEVWRRHMSLPVFSPLWRERTKAATHWLHDLVSPITGDAPNVGANDGARLLQLSDTVYRDYRPSVQLAMALFAGHRAYGTGPWDHVLHWLDVPIPQSSAPQPVSRLADSGGFAMLLRDKTMALLRYPRFRFRPGQADALHLDLWRDGVNLLRDAGSYGYNTEPQWQAYFGGTASHNTIQFDDRDQMPRLSRFLFGDWLKTSFMEPLVEDAKATRFAAGYCDRQHVSHRRSVCLSNSQLQIVDDVAGFRHKAVLRWRLAPGGWQLQNGVLTNDVHRLTVHANVPIVRCELVEGWESLHYLEKISVPVLEIEVQRPGILTTEFNWAV